MNNVETYIFIHDQEILIDFIRKNRFEDLAGFKYIFLGGRDYSKISHLSNLIVARNLEINIEEYPKLTSFTGWYALIKNKLINSEYVNLFEYDINFIPEFYEINKEMVKKDFDFIGYFPMSIFDVVYLKQTQYSDKLIESIYKKTKVDIKSVIENSKITQWSSSSNSTWKTSILNNYVEWFEQFVDDIKNNQYCGHMHERSLSFFYISKNLKVFLAKNLMTHVQLNSHGTSPLPPERAKQLYNTLV